MPRVVAGQDQPEGSFTDVSDQALDSMMPTSPSESIERCEGEIVPSHDDHRALAEIEQGLYEDDPRLAHRFDAWSMRHDVPAELGVPDLLSHTAFSSRVTRTTGAAAPEVAPDPGARGSPAGPARGVDPTDGPERRDLGADFVLPRDELVPCALPHRRWKVAL